MNRKYINLTMIFLMIWSVVALLFGACKGGNFFTSYSSRTNNEGTVAIVFTDGPTDEYEHIWIWVTRISLIPAEESGIKDATVIFESETFDGYRFDLLDLRDQEFLFTIRRDVPAGSYEKIRLEIGDIKVEGGEGECTDKEVKLPDGGKIDLNPRKRFDVVPGETLSIRLDIDARSIQLHEAGKSGKCQFRPIVFVEIDSAETWKRCPRILTGTIEEFFYGEEDEIVGFELKLIPAERGFLDVYLMDGALIFDDEGLFTGPDKLEKGQLVNIRGRLDKEGRFQALLVAVGEILIAKGTVQTPVDEHNQFLFSLGEGQELVGETSVEVADKTLILVGCDVEVDTDAIQEGMFARVVGKYSVEDEVFRAVAVLLRPQQMSGELTAMELSPDGRDLTILTGQGSEVRVFLSDNTPPYLEGDGEIPLYLLSNLVACRSLNVRVMLDPEKPLDLTAMEVRVQSDSLTGQVDVIEEDERVLFVEDDQKVYVQPGATILDIAGTVDTLVSLSEISEGDTVVCFGLQACEDDEVHFYAFVVVVGEM